MNFDYLVDYAQKNIWCTPDQDLQYRVKPARLTPYGGVWNKVDILWRTHELPEKRVRFHVYQIGQLHPKLLGLFPVLDEWVKVSDNCTKMSMIVDIYNDAGINFPRTETWFKVTQDRNLIFCMKFQDRTPIDLDKDNIYVRVYSNAYFQSVRSHNDPNYVKVAGKRVLNQQEILDLQVEFDYQSTLTGQTYAYVNGYKVSGIDLITAKVGDVVEYVYDSSIKRVIDFKIANLRTFESILDGRRKYLLHYAGKGDMIDFEDDIDVHLIKPMLNNRHTGVMFHKNSVDALRNLTHKDYSVPVQLVMAFSDYQQPAWGNPNELYLRLHIRHSGYQRPLVFEASRIHELYKLKDADIRRAMLGLDSVVPEFRAENLEKAAYTQIMAESSYCLPRKTAQDGLGYNAISTVLAATPSFVRNLSNYRVIDVPYGLQQAATGYEYDADGLLLDWHPHLEGSIYAARDLKTRMVEMIANYVNDRLDETYGEQIVTIDPTANYRMYTCPIVAGVPTNKWVDVTDSSQYAIQGTKLTWLTNPATTYTLVRGDKITLGYKLDLIPVGGVLKFTLKHRAYRNNNLIDQIMQIPMGELDLFMNGRSLIEDVDYKVVFPEVVIYAKEYLKPDPNAVQNIVVRFSGFCKSDFTRENMEDKGFVDHGLLSRNNRFDIRDDKVLRMTVHGKLYDRSELEFAETHSGVNVPDERNGSPYLIRDIVVPLRGLTEDDTYSLRAKSLVTDKRVSDYLTTKIPQPTMDTPNVIQQRYQIYSPFICKIMYDLKSGVIDDPRLVEHYNENVVREICADYEYLLKFDPSQSANAPDDKYVVIHPNNLMTITDLNIYQLKFLERVVDVYTANVVSLRHYIRLVEL